MATCRICDTLYEEFISFGEMPIANGFLPPEDFDQEYYFEMKVGFCSSCSMVQLLEQPQRERMFHEDYAFFSSLSKGQTAHFKNFADSLMSEYLTGDDPFAVEIGSNDGIMLQNLASAGIRHLGVEPSENVANVAREKGINTISSFFDEKLAADIIEKHGRADTISSANVICHIPYIHSVLAGIAKLLKPRGAFIFEDPYLGDIIEKVSYDQIYDEHVFYFSATSVSNMIKQHGLELFDVEHLNVHGGSMRYFIAKKGSRKVTEDVQTVLANEERLGITLPETYETLRRNIEGSRDQLVKLLNEIKTAQGSPVIAYGATSKSTTVLNYCNIGPDLIAFISDTTPLKQNKFSPGMHIPIKASDEIEKNQPSHMLLFAWNHMQEIMNKETAYNNRGGKWVVYVPEVKVI
ncbi:MAG: class I SAM-dependent methyltransferase [Gammaproteobacteria bacterium]|nr:class I SAM-dependent methyltransferase [Gammaproteobacteria bacterium]